MEEKEINMTVSPVCTRDGGKVAYVSFTDGTRTAEGEIPICKITKNKGFTADEVQKLEDYMKRELTVLKKMASQINIFDAFLGKTK